MRKTGVTAIPNDMVKLHHEDAGGCCFDGRQYTGDCNGNVIVPAEAAFELLAHGFVQIVLEQVQRAAASAPKSGKPASSNRSDKG